MVEQTLDAMLADMDYVLYSKAKRQMRILARSRTVIFASNMLAFGSNYWISKRLHHVSLCSVGKKLGEFVRASLVSFHSSTTFACDFFFSK